MNPKLKLIIDIAKMLPLELIWEKYLLSMIASKLKKLAKKKSNTITDEDVDAIVCDLLKHCTVTKQDILD